MSPDFTPVDALVGGVLIGLAATLLMATLGRILGVSGMLGAVLGGDGGWPAFFLAGMVAGAGLWLALAPGAPVPRTDFPLPLLVAGGLLVGIGTRLGSGCTSGHGVCGLARLSKRSVVAVGVFMATALITVALVRHAVPGGLS
jgi:uncharacterized membrane protein YedE/YeeE